MFSKTKTLPYTADCSEQLERLRGALQSAETVVVGAGAGLSTSAGMSYSGERFERYFADFKAKYGITDMYSGGFYPFETLEEYWAWWSRHIFVNRYAAGVGQPYADLLALLEGKDYFVLTTNVDHQFQLAGFDKKRLFYTQGDYGLWQCSEPCHARTYDNEAAVRQMVKRQRDMKIPTELIPRCPRCGAPMTMNLRCDGTFVEDAGWLAAAERYSDFLHSRQSGRVVFLELGVGANTPSIIKYPFWRMTELNPRALYVCINKSEAACPRSISSRAVCIDADIGQTLQALLG
ncbi:MAG: Sir2 silent information regulator family NAD-dependent deacetylase [Oscillospiraceae bacterium]|nr:Sir2 silent information regulator family NAD-dependent deacetylase [Oscillospiraceae bacterium]